MGSLVHLVLAGMTLLAMPLYERDDEAFKDATEGWSAPRLAAADVVGILELVRPGAEVAEYRVSEAWLGPPPGSLLLVHNRRSTNPAKPRYVAMLHRVSRPVRLEPSFASGLPAPDRWRQLPYDYEIDEIVHVGAVGPLWFQGSDYRVQADGLEALGRDMRAYLARPAAERELDWARHAMHRFLARWNRNGEDDPLRQVVDGAPTLDRLVEALDGLGGTDDGPNTIPLFGVLVAAGPAARDALARHDHSVPERPAPQRLVTPPPIVVDLVANRAAIADGFGPQDPPLLFDELAATDPVPLARWLAQWDPHGTGFLVASDGYVMGAWFARAAGPHRREALDLLQEAHDPLIRVAAAVQLAFDDPEAGRTRLRALAELPGDTGAWANVTLARRGDREAFIRAIEHPSGSDNRLQAHIDAARTLLVDEAVLTGGGGENAELLGHPREWLSAHPNAVIRDPWLPELAERHCD